MSITPDTPDWSARGGFKHGSILNGNLCPYRVNSQRKSTLLGYSWPFPGRPPKHDLSTWTVTDDWPDPVPVTEAEIEVFERWFGDLFDELFGSSDP